MAGCTSRRSSAGLTASVRQPACAICHQQANFDPARMPGHPEWHLAPFEMGWQGKSLHDICVQIKDPARNGGRSLGDLIHHIGEDTLVGWAWAPGFGREPAPGTKKRAVPWSRPGRIRRRLPGLASSGKEICPAVLTEKIPPALFS